MLFIFTILELNDTFTGYRIYILFLSSGLLVRNYLFTWFKNTPVFVSNLSKNIKNLSMNNIKFLFINFNTTNLLLISSLKAKINTFFKK